MTEGIVSGISAHKFQDTLAAKNKYAVTSGDLALPYVPRRGYALCGERQVHFRDTGSGSPLILCHQSPETSRQYSAVYELLHLRGIRAIGVDSPGFGESDPLPYVPTIEDWATSFIAVLDHLGIEKADILGHHTGAMVANEVAIRFPDRIRKLILNCPMLLESEDERMKWLESAKKESEFQYQEDGSHLVRIFTIPAGNLSGVLTAEVKTRIAAQKFAGYAPFFIGHHAAHIYDHRSAITRISHPTLVLSNTGDIIHSHSERVCRVRPDFAYTALEGGGVFCVDNMPEAWTEAVVAFLQE